MELRMGFEVTVMLMLKSPIKSRDLVLFAGVVRETLQSHGE